MNTEIKSVKDIIKNQKLITKGCYLAGPIYKMVNYKRKFTKAENTVKRLMQKDFPVLNPSVLPEGLTKNKYMTITQAMVECIDTIVLIDGWEKSNNVKELLKSTEKSKKEYLIIYIPDILEEIKSTRRKECSP